VVDCNDGLNSCGLPQSLHSPHYISKVDLPYLHTVLNDMTCVWAGSMIQVEELLPSKHKVLNSSPSTIQKQNKKKVT
jgi:hypothetical protein